MDRKWPSAPAQELQNIQKRLGFEASRGEGPVGAAPGDEGRGLEEDDLPGPGLREEACCGWRAQVKRSFSSMLLVEKAKQCPGEVFIMIS